MKQLITALTIVTLLFSCNENRVDYEINGTAKDVYNGIRVYLKQLDDRGREVIIDTAIVMNETFKMNGSVETPDVYFMSINSVNGRLPFMLENSEIDITIDKTSIVASTVSGSNSHESFVAYQDGFNTILEERRTVFNKYRSYGLVNDTIRADSVSKILEGLNEKIVAYPLDFTKANKDEFFSLNIIEKESKKRTFDLDSYLDAFNNLSPSLKNSSKGLKVKITLDQLSTAHEKTAHLDIGKMAPIFEAPTPDGNIVSLKQLMGKVTIIDFWAAWCGPCRKENPNVVRVYNKFHDEGLEIIGVSLDGSSRQPNPKKAWLDAIEQDGLAWHHVSNLNYFNCPVAQQYNISSIPATYILDEKGKIVAKNLRGVALENKVKELLSK